MLQARRQELALSIAVALTCVAVPAEAAATVYTQPVTGVAGNDAPGGSGGYNPGYIITSKQTGLALDGGVNQVSSKLQMYTSNNTIDQKWIIH